MDDLLFPGCEKCVRLNQAVLDAKHPVAALDAWIEYLKHLDGHHASSERLFARWMVTKGIHSLAETFQAVQRGGGEIPPPHEKVAR